MRTLEFLPRGGPRLTTTETRSPVARHRPLHVQRSADNILPEQQKRIERTVGRKVRGRDAVERAGEQD